MSFTTDLIANLRYQLQAMNIDSDPTMPELTIEVQRNSRSGTFRELKIHRRTLHQPAPAGVVVREALDNGHG
jgi:hypothetical protein